MLRDLGGGPDGVMNFILKNLFDLHIEEAAYDLGDER